MAKKPVLLLAVDFSTPCRKALDATVPLARDLGARVVLFHAFAPPPGGPAAGEAAAKLQGRQEHLEAKGAMEVQDAVRLSTEWAGVLRDAGVDVETATAEAKAPDAIVAAAAEHGAAIIVVGSHGWGGLKRLLMGSVAEAVMRRSVVPVLVVPSRDAASD